MISRIRRVASRYPLWCLFVLFAVLESFLSYFPLSNAAKITLFALGILFPLLAAARFLSGIPAVEAIFHEEFLPAISGWNWTILGLACLFLHFFKLNEPWPTWLKSDEGLNGLFAIGLSERWNWKYFYFSGQFPGVLIWASGFLSRFIRNPFLALWAVPALVSTSLLPLGYLALRSTFSKSFSFVGACLITFSLWVFAAGRMVVPGPLILPWEMVCLFLLGGFLREKDPGIKKRWAAFLGFSTGLCYLNCPTWPFVVLLVFLTAFGGTWRRPLHNGSFFPRFFIFFLGALVPFLVLWGKGEYSISNRFLSSFGDAIPLAQRGQVIFSYFSSLFWGPLRGVGVFFSENLERFNPVLGAAFFVGVLQWWRARSQRVSQWLGLAFLVFFSPAFVSVYVEMLRILTLLPVLLLVTAWGTTGLLLEVRKPNRIFALLLLLGVSVVSDGIRVWQLHRDPATVFSNQLVETIQLGSQRAYQILADVSRKDGPGLIFTEFQTHWNDQTVFVTTYPFNAAENPRLDPAHAKWAAVLTDDYYFPFLSRRFPEAHWLEPGRGLPEGAGMLLGLIPVAEGNWGTLVRWMSAHHVFREMREATADISTPETYGRARKILAEGQKELNQDRFLESSYWELMAEFYYQYDYRSHYQDLVGAVQKAIRRGYPASPLYYRLGSLYLRKGNFKEARRAFRAALREQPENGDVLKALSLLSRMEKRNGERSH